MRLDLFSEDDHVLLVGEGNFSFSVCLLKHKLPIKITATCFETEPRYKQLQENVEYLKSKEVPVFFNVDATSLNENPNICGKNFSKIIFNFPHIGGKMKIHLNRLLMKKFFESCKGILADEGVVLVTLCRGQGGTPADQPQRKWPDSWQITEMAASGDFILTSVEPFHGEYFDSYNCIGYRSQDVRFNTDGALVHVFVKKWKPFFNCFKEDIAKYRLSLTPLTGSSTVYVPPIYSEFYENNPLSNPDSVVNFLKGILVKDLEKTLKNPQVKFLADEDIPIFVEDEKGIPCEVNGSKNRYSLRYDATQGFLSVFQSLQLSVDDDEIVIFSGVYFSPTSGEDFTRKAPLNLKFLIWGKDLPKKLFEHFHNIAYIFKDEKVVYSSRAGKASEKTSLRNMFSVNFLTEIVCTNEDASNDFVAATCYSLKYCGVSFEAGIINVDHLSNYFFQTSSWKEIWTDGNKVVANGSGKPTLKQVQLYPSTYKFDITLKFSADVEFSEKKLFEMLWLAAGHTISGVELVNLFASGKGWSSRCYRITYKSLDGPLFRNRVLDIHSKIVCRVLELGLNVDVG